MRCIDYIFDVHCQEIAAAMDLDVSQPAVFWKDTAAVEFNIAIVHSFQVLNLFPPLLHISWFK